MSRTLPDSKERFSTRADHYARYRPEYPSSVIHLLQSEIGLDHSWIICDVGAGTGLSSKLFLDHGHYVYGVEPNAPMREAAEALLDSHAFYQSIEGSAESTGLTDRCTDLVVAAQAFHWFDPGAARDEFRRILRPPGWVLLMWNRRLTDTTGFLRAYEDLLLRYGTDYDRVRHENVQSQAIGGFFADRYVYRQLPNRQLLDAEALKGRLLSSSYTPSPEHRDHRSMLESLHEIFEQHHTEGRVCIEYSLDLYIGQLSWMGKPTCPTHM